MEKHKFLLTPGLVVKVMVAAAFLIGIAVGILTTQTTSAQMTPQTYVVQAGGAGLGAAEALVFAPSYFKVHRGDTVTWSVNGFHNIRFTTGGFLPLALIPGVDVVDIPQINPAIAFPTIESGASFTGGEANAGLPAGAPGGAADAGGVFSLVIDAEPGTYNYLCDVHPGMLGSIEVVADDEAIASPAEVAVMAKQEIDTALAAGNEAVQAEIEAAAGGVNTAVDGVANVQAGTGTTGRTTVNRFFAFTTVIHAGESVVWTIPEGSVDPHTVTWPPLRGQEIVPVPQEGGPPILAFGPGFTPNVPPDGALAAGGAFNSGLLFPGQSFTLTFPDPGAYPFVCNIHPGMEGTVVVLPAE
jgi:plastocyanin